MSPSSKRLIFATDIDGTLIGHDSSSFGLFEFKTLWNENLKTQGDILIYNTGRGLHSYEKLREQHPDLGHPDWLICSNGCEIYEIINNKPVLNKGWDAFVSERYDKKEIAKAMNKFDEVVVPCLSAKDMYRHSITLQQLDQDPNQVKKRMERKFPNARFHLKEACTWLKGAHLLEVYPANATKLSALDFILEEIQDRQEHHRELNYMFNVIWSGDAYNDRSLCDSDYLGIIVGNAEVALKKECNRQFHYFAKQMQALGVIEGLRHYGYVQRNLINDAIKFVTLASVGVLSFFAIRKLKGAVQVADLLKRK